MFIQTLPPELLIEIFYLCLSSTGNRTINPARTSLHVLSQVSKFWRNTCLNTPGFWSSLHVFLGQWSSKEHVHKVTERVKLWLKRSDPVPLDISIVEDSFLDCSDLFLAIVSNSLRWKNLRWRTSSSAYEILARVQGSLPKLETLDLSVSREGRFSLIPRNYQIFFDAPRLRDVSLESPFYPSTILLPWHQLSSYRGIADADDYLLLLSCATRLESCTLLRYEKYRSPPTQRLVANAIPDIQNLASLCIWVDAPFITNLIGKLFLPSVHHLELHLTHQGSDWATLLPPFLRLFPNVTALVFHCALLDADILSSINCLPFLTSLHLISSIKRFACLKQLTYDPDPEAEYSLFPHVKNIVLEGILDFSPEILVSMIRSRWNPRSEKQHSSFTCLESVELRFSKFSQIKVDIFSALRLLLEEGFHNILVYDGRGRTFIP